MKMSEIKRHNDTMKSSNMCLIKITGENRENELAYIGYISKEIKRII